MTVQGGFGSIGGLALVLLTGAGSCPEVARLERLATSRARRQDLGAKLDGKTVEKLKGVEAELFGFRIAKPMSPGTASSPGKISTTCPSGRSRRGAGTHMGRRDDSCRRAPAYFERRSEGCHGCGS